MGNEWSNKSIKSITVVMKVVMMLGISAPIVVTVITTIVTTITRVSIFSVCMHVPDTVQSTLQILSLTLLHKQFSPFYLWENDVFRVQVNFPSSHGH